MAMLYGDISSNYPLTFGMVKPTGLMDTLTVKKVKTHLPVLPDLPIRNNGMPTWSYSGDDYGHIQDFSLLICTKIKHK